jgi:hypothetical protein
MKGGRKSESTLQRTQQRNTLQEISYEQNNTHAKYSMGRIARIRSNLGTFGTVRRSPASPLGFFHARRPDATLSDDFG